MITPHGTKRMVEQYYQPQLINIYIYRAAIHQIILNISIELFGEKLKMSRRLTKHSAIETEPVISPDGKKFLDRGFFLRKDNETSIY